MKNIPSFETARKSPGFSYHGTHVIIWVESFTEDGKTNPVTSGVSDLYKWYATLMKQIPKGASYNLLDQQITSLTAQAKTKEEATRTIFQWVQKNIKYIAFEQGMSGLIPREASDVYNKRYGDCKDMANLLTYMLNKAGVESYRTWIGSRHRPYKFEMVPLPIAHDHMICTAKVDDRFIFLDATDSFLDFNRPSSFIQGKEALVGMNDNEFKIENVPVRKREENQRIDSLFIHLEKDGVKGKLVSHLTGYKKEDFEKEKMRDEVNHRPNYLRDFCLIGADNVQIENILLKGFNNPDTGGKIQFDFFQPGYYKSVGNKLYLKLGMSRSFPGEIVPHDSRDQSMEEGYLFETKSITQLTLPEGYRVSSIPNDFEAKWNEFGVSSKYHMKNNVITREYVFYSNYLYLNKPLFKQWNDFIQATTDVNRQVITLSKTEN